MKLNCYYSGVSIIISKCTINQPNRGSVLNNKIYIMASIAMLVSEFAHSIKQPNNKAVRENIKLLIVHTRNEIIRRSYENHGYVDKGLIQRFKISLTDVYDGEITLPEDCEDIDITKVKRSLQKVPTPVRLTNNLPFDRVSSVGYKTSREFPFIKETTARFRSSVPGLCGMPCYDYINGYIYIFPTDNKTFDISQIIIESTFEHPTEIQIANNEVDSMDVLMDENEFLLSEDMIGQLKEIIYKRDLLSTIRETNEIPDTVKFN